MRPANGARIVVLSSRTAACSTCARADSYCALACATWVGERWPFAASSLAASYSSRRCSISARASARRARRSSAASRQTTLPVSTRAPFSTGVASTWPSTSAFSSTARTASVRPRIRTCWVKLSATTSRVRTANRLTSVPVDAPGVSRLENRTPDPTQRASRSRMPSASLVDFVIVLFYVDREADLLSRCHVPPAAGAGSCKPQSAQSGANYGYSAASIVLPSSPRSWSRWPLR